MVTVKEHYDPTTLFRYGQSITGAPRPPRRPARPARRPGRRGLPCRVRMPATASCGAPH
ncbi:hypothetical protein [Streptomyces kanamyceticus]|uniref:hypothetical protein n=1 Tax=Streptomyces kanamyceticus TaxID=1967 RepID=UPI0037DCB829